MKRYVSYLLRNMHYAKHIIIIALLIISTYSLAVSTAPFEKAKELSLKVPPSFMGAHLINMTINKDGQEIIFVMGYYPSLGLIGIGKFCGSSVTVYEYNEITGEYSVYLGSGIRKPMEPNMCLHGAFEIFREMVGEKLL